VTDSISAFAPASIGNLGVGFDMLGLALTGVGDRVVARMTEGRDVAIAEVRGLDGESHPYLSTDPKENTASIAAQALLSDNHGTFGVELEVHKGVPLQSGMGSSAASAVAAVVAVNGLLEAPLPAEALLPYALEGEKYASGGLHADNVAPSLLGGLILCPEVLLPDVIRLPVPQGVSAVLLHPDLQVHTAHARRRLAKSYSMQLWLKQQGLLAGFVAACCSARPPPCDFAIPGLRVGTGGSGSSRAPSPSSAQPCRTRITSPKTPSGRTIFWLRFVIFAALAIWSRRRD